MLSFFSSNYKSLYKEDIYRAFSYPNNHIIQLRYREQWLHQKIINKLRYIQEGTDCVLFFFDKNNMTFHSIRRAKFKKYKRSNITQQYHFFIELGEFADYKINGNVDPEFLPLEGVYVSDIELVKGDKCLWYERIEEVKNHFDEMAFFNINKFCEKGSSKPLSPQFINDETVYPLVSGKDYVMYKSMYNSSENNSNLEYTREDTDANLVFVNEPKRIIVSGSLDDREVTLVSKSIESPSLYSYVVYTAKSKSNDEEFNVPLQFKIKRSKMRSIEFGSLSVLAAGGLGVITYYTKYEATFFKDYLILGAAVVGIWISASRLYNNFNKK